MAKKKRIDRFTLRAESLALEPVQHRAFLDLLKAGCSTGAGRSAAGTGLTRPASSSSPVTAGTGCAGWRTGLRRPIGGSIAARLSPRSPTTCWPRIRCPSSWPPPGCATTTTTDPPVASCGCTSLGATTRAPGRPTVPLTRRIAHHFLRAPAHYSIEGAVRWGQIAALGGAPQLADACVATRLGQQFDNDAFWLSVLRWFIAHPTFDLAQVGPLVDFIRHVKFEEGAQPGFSMARRTPESLLRQTERWHARLHRGSATPTSISESWPTPDIHGLRWKTVRRGVTTKWTIEQLDSTAALEREGQEMRHCVASYAAGCARRGLLHLVAEGDGRRQGYGAADRRGQP